ncbi:MAG TPA: LCP family protein [Solirubrobacteraceae bacterium]|nr:LCP family protein [Solirubrobacteraceae bacterium]
MIPHSRGGMLWRFFLAAIVVIAATAATTAVAGLLQFKQLAIDLSGQPALKNANVTLPPPGAPQTLLIVGSDHRAGTSYTSANTDTMMLVRLDPNSSTVNVLSIPRDLEVTIPGYGTAKVNAAYSDGGPNLMIKTIQQNVFPDLKVNHILDVNFQGFSDLVDAIGCVYSAVDERYYNNTALTGYSSIDIQPGYQKLCGANQAPGGALAFVRYRHTDSDIVRNARQQDFIRWAKDQYSTTQIYNNKDKLLSIFGNHVQTDHDLHTVDGLINLFNLVLNMSGHTIKSIKFPAILNNCPAAVPGQVAPPCYVNSNTGAEQQVFAQFMKATSPADAKAATTGAAKKTSAPAKGKSGRAAAPGVPAGLTDASTDGQTQAGALKRVPFPVYYPKLIQAGSAYCSSLTGNCNDGQEPAVEYAHSYPRSYTIHGHGGTRYAAYYMSLEINPLLGEYYGVQGTTWLNPPLLASPSATKVVDGKKLELFAAGGKLMTVAWKTPGAVYWIENTLAGTIPNSQMVAIAASLTRAR